MPLPCTTRSRIAPARNARSTNFSTACVASSTVWPMTLISVGTLSSSRASETLMPRERAASTGLPPACATTLAISSRATFIFIGPTATSKRVIVEVAQHACPSRPSDLRRTVSPTDTCFTTCCCALGSPASAPVVCATTVESNCSRNSRRILAMRRSASLDSFSAWARSCTALTVSRARYSKSRSTLSSFFSSSRSFSRCSLRPSSFEMLALARQLLLASAKLRRARSPAAATRCAADPESARHPAPARSCAGARLPQCGEFRPSFCAMLMPADAPGTPMRSS